MNKGSLPSSLTNPDYTNFELGHAAQKVVSREQQEKLLNLQSPFTSSTNMANTKGVVPDAFLGAKYIQAMPEGGREYLPVEPLFVAVPRLVTPAIPKHYMPFGI